ncbi:MAG: helix-turn-helix domain-containing protein [Candidatus Micrarchaeota archaeon]|nr:helix-turn-helix domain-containing protein [Candidatus Micrarchaeota archaeon]
MEELLCRTITKLVLPAVRASVSEKLHKEHGYTQEKIADKIGIVQVGVGKYLNGKYSQEVRDIKEYIDENELSEPIIKGILGGCSLKETERQIDILCNDSNLIDFAMRYIVALNR